jgi:hypothetical protein
MPFDVISTVPLSGYAPSTALGVDTTTPQLYISGTGQMWEPVGGVALPVSVANGGTGATTAGGARTNLGAAARGANNDITSLADIPATAINGSGYAYNDGTDPATVIGPNWLYGTAFNSGGPGVQVANQVWTGAGYTGYGIGVTGSGEFSLMGASGFFTSEGVHCESLIDGGAANIGGILSVGSGATNAVGIITAVGTSNNALQIGGEAITGPISVIISSGSGASPISGVGLLAFGANYPTQTTIGAAGSASVIPGAPKKWIQLCDTDGSIVAFPVWAHA